MRSTKKKLPDFKNEDQERKFWATADSTQYIDWRSAKRSKPPRLMPSLRKMKASLAERMAEKRQP